MGKQSQLLLKPSEVELGLQVGVEFDKTFVKANSEPITSLNFEICLVSEGCLEVVGRVFGVVQRVLKMSSTGGLRVVCKVSIG